MDAAIAAIWARSLPVVRERLRVLEEAAAALEGGDLRDAERVAAVGEAHKLAGSLGMFGFAEGTEIARVLEEGMERGDLEGGRMRMLVGDLRRVLGDLDFGAGPMGFAFGALMAARK